MALPQQIIVMVVTPTTAQDAGAQQNGGQQEQGQDGQEAGSQGEQSQTVAQAEATPGHRKMEPRRVRLLVNSKRSKKAVEIQAVVKQTSKN